MFKKLVLGLGVMLVLLVGCDMAFAEEVGTATEKFQIRVGKVVVGGQNVVLTAVQARFYTQILNRNSGVAIGVVAGGSDDRIYLFDYSYQLLPDVFDIVVGLAVVQRDIEKDLKYTYNWGINLNANVFKEMAQKIVGMFPF